jgi:L-fuconolactonase
VKEAMPGITIDAHQHVWDPARARYSWLTSDLAPIDRTMEFEELRPALAAAGIDGTVLVQSADNAEDTALMFDVAAENPEVLAIVGYLPLEHPEDAARELAELRSSSLLVGIRNLIHNQPDPDWLLRPDVDEGLGVLEAAGLSFDLVAVLPRHLELVPLISARHPELRIVIDHLGKPPIGLASPEPWESLMRVAAENPNVFAKVSGLYSASGDSGSWTVDSVRPYFERAVDLFGADRLMYGGDWPISVLSGGYARVWDGLSELFATLDDRESDAIRGTTAATFYRIAPARIAAATTDAGSPTPLSAP